MPKRTSPHDAERIGTADNLEDIVQDKRAHWRATDAKARRRQRRYKALLTQQLIRLHDADTTEPDSPFGD